MADDEVVALPDGTHPAEHDNELRAFLVDLACGVKKARLGLVRASPAEWAACADALADLRAEWAALPTGPGARGRIGYDPARLR